MRDLMLFDLTKVDGKVKMKKMTKKDLTGYWLKGSDEALQVAEDLHRLKHRSFCLFFCHLALEKAIKAILTKKYPGQSFYIHSLSKLATTAELDLPAVWLEILDEISTFNVKARYNDVKLELYKRATPNYTKRFLVTTKEIQQWLKRKISEV